MNTDHTNVNYKIFIETDYCYQVVGETNAVLLVKHRKLLQFFQS